MSLNLCRPQRSVTVARAPRVMREWMQRLYLEADHGYRDQILSLLPARPELRILDVVCDDGAWTSELARKAGAAPSQVAGIEILERRRQLALARGFDVRGADLDELWPFDDSSFDVVHANQVIEHVHGLDHFVSETRRVLAVGGQAIVCTENLASWHNIFALTMGWMPFSLSNISARGNVGNPLSLHMGEEPAHGDSWQHTRVLSLSGLRSIFQLHGMTVESVFASGYYPASGELSRALARRDARHAHFIGVAARRA